MTFLKKAAWFAALAVCFFITGCPASIAGNAADFTLRDLGGEEVSLGRTLAEHKAVLLNFWATWCPPCREEIPGLIDLQKKHGGNAFTVLGVDIGESAAKVSGFVKKIGINYPVLLDGEQRVAEMYRVVGIPTSYLISRDGKILGEYHAYSPELVADVEQAIQ